MTDEEMRALQEQIIKLEARVEFLEALLLADEEEEIDIDILETQHQEFVSQVRSLRDQ